jgi:hypothetical protein
LGSVVAVTATIAQWEADFKRFTSMIDTAKSYKGKLGSSADDLLRSPRMADRSLDARREARQLRVLNYSADSSDSANQRRLE